MNLLPWLIVLILILLFCNNRESFSTRREKAETIYEWFTNNLTHSYADFREYTGGQSNIVVYEDMKELFRTKDFTVGNIEKQL